MFITNGRYGDAFACWPRLTATPTLPPGDKLLRGGKRQPRLQGGRDLEKLGYRGLDTCELIFEDYRIPAENLVGGARATASAR